MTHDQSAATADEDRSLYDRLLRDIASGVFPGGERLKVQELASRYGTSTNPVREVLRQLQGEGYVIFSPNKGATVRKADANEIRDVFELLQLLEPYFVAWFAEFGRSEMIDRMESIQNEIERLPHDDLMTFRRLDTQFHAVACDYHYNARAVTLWKAQRVALNVFTTRISFSTGRRKDIFAEHRALIDAFCRSDVEAAVAIIKRHIEGAGEQMYKQVRAVELWPVS